eukprot:3317913-Amphidinium_carterae.2
MPTQIGTLYNCSATLGRCHEEVKNLRTRAIKHMCHDNWGNHINQLQWRLLSIGSRTCLTLIDTIGLCLHQVTVGVRQQGPFGSYRV